MSKNNTNNPNTSSDCSSECCQPKPSRRQFFGRGAQSIAAIGVAVQTGKSASEARPKPGGWFSTGLGQTRDMTVADDLIYVAGDSAVAVFKSSGELVRRVDFDYTPRCIAVEGSQMAVGFRDRLWLCDLDGTPQVKTQQIAKDTALTSLAIAGDGSIYAADGGVGAIWKLNSDGKILERIAGGKGGGFAVPKSFFPITWAADSLVVAHPGRHRVEQYDADGELKLRWGRRTRGLNGFTGCCNPVSVVVTESGQFVTAERGQPRIKLFDNDGKLHSVIAEPEAFDITEHQGVDTEADLVTCQNGGIELALLGDRVIALDHTITSFRLFDLT